MAIHCSAGIVRLLCFFQYQTLDEFHHFQFHQLFYVGIPCFNLGIEGENNKSIIYAEKSKV